jgi:hypothetical protein
MDKQKIKVVNGIRLEQLPDKASMLYFLDGFYHKYGTAETLEVLKELPREQLAVYFLKAYNYAQEHPDEKPGAVLPDNLLTISEKPAKEAHNG